MQQGQQTGRLDRRAVIPDYDQRVGASDFTKLREEYRAGAHVRARIRGVDPMAQTLGSDR